MRPSIGSGLPVDVVTCASVVATRRGESPSLLGAKHQRRAGPCGTAPGPRRDDDHQHHGSNAHPQNLADGHGEVRYRVDLASEMVVEPGDDPISGRWEVNLDSLEFVGLSVLVERIGRLREARMRQIWAALSEQVDCQ